ncbi:Ig-like domain-containing protein [Cohnella sp. GbtcB17]|uniref:Ig-like domain-containing protein n=1 Tax=Cohnella sp. GbtcB17 TaxID=2824762 RepID=UPI001C30AC6E|nr:Ig-like domain-containing protein [Cohnella sp. GbtcB17]
MKSMANQSKKWGILSSLLAATLLMPSGWGGGKAYAKPTPQAPAYTGSLTWVNYTEPAYQLNPPQFPTNPGETYMPMFMDIDNAGHFYISKLRFLSMIGSTPLHSGKIEKLSDNGETSTDITYDSGVTTPIGIAVNDAGDVYVADNTWIMGTASSATPNTARLLKLTHGTTSWEQITPVGLKYAMGVEVDRQGNVYVIDGIYGNQTGVTPHIWKWNQAQSTWTDIATSAVTNPLDIAVDSAGNVFITNTRQSPSIGTSPYQVLKLTAGSTNWTDITPSSSGISFAAYGIGIDRYDNVWAANMAAGLTGESIAMKLASGGGSGDWVETGILSNASNQYQIFDVAADSSGYIYGTNYLSGNISTLRAALVYDGNGGTGSSLAATPVGYLPNETAIVADQGDLVRPGYVFKGWSTTGNMPVDYAPGDTIVMTETKKLRAVWGLPAVITGIQLDSTAYTLDVGGTHLSAATARYDDNSTKALSSGVTYSSSNSEVATVDASGMVTAVAAGEATITAQYGNYQAQASVTVNDTPPAPAITGIQLDSSAYSLDVGGTHQSVATAVYDDNSTKALSSGVTYSSSNSEVATVDASGMVTAVAAGEATITAQYGNYQAQASVTVNDTPPPAPAITGIQLDSSAYSLDVGGTHQSVATAVYDDNSTKALSSGVTYSSSNSEVATVDASGMVTAVAAGQTIITAVYGDYRAEANVTVNNAPTPPPTTPAPANPDVEIWVDGVKQDQLATAQHQTVGGRTVTTVKLDNQKVLDKLSRENSKLLTIPVGGSSDDVIGELNGSVIKALESNAARLQIQTGKGTYTIPASLIDIGGLSAQLSAGSNLQDITIRIQISASSADKTAQVHEAAKSGQLQTIGSPVDFEITAVYGTQSVPVNKFGGYVERKIAIPDDVSPSGITTGVVLTDDGSLHHEPTVVVQENGKYFAKINSLTNSTYSVIYNPRAMGDVSSHWASAEVNDMTSRLIIEGVNDTEFMPDAAITRAEFAAIVTRGLGIQSRSYTGGFSDVASGNWYAGAVQAAADYGLIDGYVDGTYLPNRNITRQEAVAVLIRAGAIPKLEATVTTNEANRALSAFADGGDVPSWARSSIASAINLNLLKGRGGKLDPEANLTRAEAAVIVRRLLQAADLIN